MRDKISKIALAGGTALAFIAPVLAQVDYSYSTSSSSGDGAAGVFVLALYCCLCIFSLAIIGLHIYLIIDALKRDFGSDNSMLIVSLLLLLFLGFPVGTLLYYFLVMKKYPMKKK